MILIVVALVCSMPCRLTCSEMWNLKHNRDARNRNKRIEGRFKTRIYGFHEFIYLFISLFSQCWSKSTRQLKINLKADEIQLTVDMSPWYQWALNICGISHIPLSPPLHRYQFSMKQKTLKGPPRPDLLVMTDHVQEVFWHTRKALHFCKKLEVPFGSPQEAFWDPVRCTCLPMPTHL